MYNWKKMLDWKIIIYRRNEMKEILEFNHKKNVVYG